jgi:hypothetical protein
VLVRLLKTNKNSGLDRRAVMAMIFGVYQENRGVQYRIEATEVWFAYQVNTTPMTATCTVKFCGLV